MWTDIKYIILLIFIFDLSQSFRREKQEEIEQKTTTEVGVNNATDVVTRTESKVITWKSLNDDNNINFMFKISKDEDNNETTDKQDYSTEPTTTSPTTSTTKIILPITWEPAEISLHSLTSTEKYNKTNSTSVKEEVCERYKYSTIKFDLNKMVDVWQTVYYQLPAKVQCFKIHIRKVSEEEKQKYSETYGNFSGVVDWNECNLEINAAAVNGRRHFLQGINADEGVMDNIIIIEEGETDPPKVQEESADQWLAVHNLLLMRDCDTGGVVVFSKVPYNPRQQDIEDALKDFNEEFSIGKMACEDEDFQDRSLDTDDELD